MSGPTKADLLVRVDELEATLSQATALVVEQTEMIRTLGHDEAHWRWHLEQLGVFPCKCTKPEVPYVRPPRPLPAPVAVDTGPRFPGDSMTPKGATEIDPR